MTHLYIWVPHFLPPLQARRCFTDALEHERTSLESFLGVPCTSRHAVAGNVFIGQIARSDEPRSMAEWWECDGSGIAWSGVCDDALGKTWDRESIDAFRRTIADSSAFIQLKGRFVVCTWRQDGSEVLCAVGATDAPAFWFLQGPLGWAAGNRITPLHRLSGCPTAMDRDYARLFLAFGYHAGDGCFFSGVRRLRTGSLIRSSPSGLPRISRHASLADYLLPLPVTGLSARSIEQGADCLVDRVQREIAFAEQPRLLLTGGTDSRCIAAAAVAAGFDGPAVTSGAPGSRDVRLARKVAHRLGLRFTNAVIGRKQSAIVPLLQNPDRLLAWMRYTEGIDTLRHALPYRAFFDRTAPRREMPHQLFHGSHGIGGLVDYGRYHICPSADQEGMAVFGVMASGRDIVAGPMEPVLEIAAADCWSDIGALPLEREQKLRVFAWQRRARHFAGNTLSVADPFHWHWTPLMDRSLIQANLIARPEEDEGKFLIRGITERLSPRLRRIPYESVAIRRTGKPDRLMKLVDLLLGYHPRLPYLGRYRAQSLPRDRDLSAFWESVLFSPRREAWKEFADPRVVAEIARRDQASDLLWRTATLQLVAEALAG